MSTPNNNKEIDTMKTYARYIYTCDMTAKKVGNEWHEVTNEKMEYRPSGRHLCVTINGVSVKAEHCEIVTVFDK